MIGAIILQIVLIFLNAVFASAEIAVISTNEAKLEKLSEEGDKKAKRLLSLTKNPSKFLSTIQVAITLAGLLGSAYAADNFADPLVKWLVGLGVGISESTLNSICVFVITLILSYFSIVFGELVPKRLAMKNAEKMALGMSGTLKFVSCVFAPFVWILTKSTNGLLRLFHIDPNEQGDAVTEEEIRMMLDTGSERGTIDSMENEMIQNVFEFDDISISEICTHRRDVTILYKEDPLSEWKKTIAETRHSFYPICGEDTDDVIGVLNIKKFFRTDNSTPEAVIRAAAEKPYFVPENMKADVLFQNMKETRNYFAIVIDEYGGMSGVVTMHDLLELLVGDLVDKDEEYSLEIEKLGENEWRIAGAASLEKVGEELELSFDAEECDTFGGYIFGLLGAVPDDGTTLELETDDLKIQVVSVEDHRIESTVVRKKERETTETADED
ncbi:MAG: HlyC/CorC family transporter [Clostridiales bacterium]|nr:HlyC/CorC family transporter [Clostridiales bacterium]